MPGDSGLYAFVRFKGGKTKKGPFTISGDADDAFHRNWNEISGFGHSATWPSEDRAGAGVSVVTSEEGAEEQTPVQPQCQHADFVFSKRTDVGTPALFQAASLAAYFESFRLELCREAGAGLPYFVIHLKNVGVRSVEFSGGFSEGLPVEKVTLVYSEIHWLYLQWSDGGLLQRKVFGAFNHDENTPIAFDNTILQEMTLERLKARAPAE